MIEWQPLHVALEREEPIDLGIEACATGELSTARAIEVYAQARRDRATTGMTPIILAEDAGQSMWGGGFSEYDERAQVAASLADLERTAASALLVDGANRESRIDAVLDRLGKVAGCDPMSILHRIDAATLDEIENEDGVELDPECFGPDDMSEAYRAGVEARKESRFFELDSVRPYDLDTAVAELMPGRSRVVLLATTPARALLYLGFGSFNACPEPHVHARVWEHWFETLGAEPAVIEASSVSGIVARPITTRAELVRFAREVSIYNSDAIDGMLGFLGSTVRNARIRCWWD